MRTRISLAVLLLTGLSLAQAADRVDIELGPEEGGEGQVSAHPQNSHANQCGEAASVKMRVRSVKVEGRWAGQVSLPVATDDRLSNEKISQALEVLRARISDESIGGYGLRSKGEIGVLYIDVNCVVVGGNATRSVADSVDMIFRPYYVRVSLRQIGDNVLPIPRTSQPTFYQNVPKPLLALNPSFSGAYDQAFGAAIGGSVQTDVLNLSDPARKDAAPSGNQRFDVHATGMKSVEHDFYRASTGFRYSGRLDGTNETEWNLRANYDGAREPLADIDHSREAGTGSIGATFKLAPTTRLSLDVGYRRTDDSVESPGGGPQTRTNADEQLNRVLLDSLPPPHYGFARAAVWEDNGRLGGSGDSYQRLAVRAGYAKEISFQPNQTLGFEVVAGVGKVWGNAPDYARFFGGNSPGQFLYDSPSSSVLLDMPAGPLIRSFGQGQAGLLSGSGAVRGSDAYWHVNLTLAFPIRNWSRPLIPNESTDMEDAEGRPVSLKQLLKTQIDVTGPSMLTPVLQKEGLDLKEAQGKAKKTFDEVRPAINFVIDDANLYSIKPLLMLDAAGMSGTDGSSSNWLAAGLGLQLTIVVAKFEGGYMRTLSGPTFGDRENVFFRLVFQNLF